MARGPSARFEIRRIVVALDSSPNAQAALAAAGDLAVRMSAEIEALFVEDINLLRLAELNLGREFDLASRRLQPIDLEQLETWFLSQANEARRAIEAMARQSRVAVSFRVVRGSIEREVMAAVSGADLLVLGMAGRSIFVRSGRPGSTALAAAERAPRSVLLIRPGGRISGRAIVVYDGTKGANRALLAAARIADEGRDGLTVLLVGSDEDAASKLKTRALAQLTKLGLSDAVFRRLSQFRVENTCQIAYEAGADVLVVSADHPALEGETRERLLAEIGCPVLLVR